VNLLELLIAITVAGICGAFAEFIAGYSPGSLLLVVLVGIVGAYMGNGLALWLDNIIPGSSTLLLVRVGNISFDVVWAIIGSTLLLLLLSLLRGGRRRQLFARTPQE
jgi:uncharacterized membrane protein YeaQ/YmgE (transglycosylase-associated protein family)